MVREIEPTLLDRLVRNIALNEEVLYLSCASLLVLVIAARDTRVLRQVRLLRNYMSRQKKTRGVEVKVSDAPGNSGEVLQSMGFFKESDDHRAILNTFVGILTRLMNEEAMKGDFFVFGGTNSVVTQDDARKEVMIKMSQLFQKYWSASPRQEKKVFLLISQVLGGVRGVVKGTTRQNTRQKKVLHSMMGSIYFNIPSIILVDLIRGYKTGDNEIKDRLKIICTGIYKRMHSLWEFVYVMFTAIFSYISMGDPDFITKENFKKFSFGVLTLRFIDFENPMEESTKKTFDSIRDFWYSENNWTGEAISFKKPWEVLENNIFQIYGYKFWDGGNVVLENQDGWFYEKDISQEYAIVADMIWNKMPPRG